MITRDEAYTLLKENVKNINLQRHCLAVESVMKALARRFGEDEESWGIAGLLHDADYEVTKDDTSKHTKLVIEWLKKLGSTVEIDDAILAHGWGYVDGNPQPKNEMEWSLFCCDELTGLIVAVALVKPDKKLSEVTADSVLRKWDEKSFAKGVDRNQIKKCEDMLHIPLREFVEIALKAMQSRALDLGL